MSKPGTLSIRRALVAGMSAMALVPALVVGVVGVHNLNRSVRDEAQARVNRILGIATAAYLDSEPGAWGAFHLSFRDLAGPDQHP